MFFFIISGIFFFSHVINAAITYNTQTPDLGGATISFDGDTKPLGEYIRKVYNYGVGITAILATVVLMIGGFQWIVAGGSGEKIGEAKAWITAALSGLVLALSSYMILNLVNSKLVNFTVKTIPLIEELNNGCCEVTEAGVKKAVNIHSVGCTNLKGTFLKGGISNAFGTECLTPTKNCWWSIPCDTSAGENYLSTNPTSDCGPKTTSSPTTASIENCCCKTIVAFASPSSASASSFTPYISGSGAIPNCGIVNDPATGIKVMYPCTDATVRNALKSNGVNVKTNYCTYAGQTNCTTVKNMDTAGINLMISIKKSCDSINGGNCNMLITGGTEAGHASHKEFAPIFDVGFNDPKLNKYIRDQVDTGGGAIKLNTTYPSKDGSYRIRVEGDHFHIEAGTRKK
ncbi:MAG: pilin [Candidatus Magasanikbacteria bacterium]|nr:pilin [Candidatus Magasanikbacteria bacterium]